MELTDKQREEVDKVIYEKVQENLDDLTVFEDYWHGMICSDGTVLDINIYDTAVYGIDQEGLQCAVYFVNKDDAWNQAMSMNIDYEHWVSFKSKHLDGIDPNTNAQVEDTSKEIDYDE